MSFIIKTNIAQPPHAPTIIHEGGPAFMDEEWRVNLSKEKMMAITAFNQFLKR